MEQNCIVLCRILEWNFRALLYYIVQNIGLESWSIIVEFQSITAFYSVEYLSGVLGH